MPLFATSVVLAVASPLTVPAVAVAAGRGHESAKYALDTYGEAVVRMLSDLVAFRTVHQEGKLNRDLPAFKEMTAYLQRTADAFGFDFTNSGAVVVIGMGKGPQRLGLITHGDVQPADPTKWANDPFTLDTRSRPGLLVGRGTEDDKGPVAAVLHAMKALKDRGTPLSRRIELIISYTEESDWAPFSEYLAKNPPPEMNVVLDAEFPVVVAEKGWVGFELKVSGPTSAGAPGAALVRFDGGAFLSQVPDEATAEIRGADQALLGRLRAAAAADTAGRYSLETGPESLTIHARGVSAHSSKPWEGMNAITHLAETLSVVSWPPSPSANAVRAIHDLIGTGYQAERFGTIAYSDAFMGPLTLSLGTARGAGDSVTLGINLRRPVGKKGSELEAEIRETVTAWQKTTGIPTTLDNLQIYDPYDARQAPQVPALLDIFRDFTGQRDARPISMGGGTHARLVPNGVCFGPVMPGEPYTGHAEGEHIDRSELLQALQIYTAMLDRLAGE